MSHRSLILLAALTWAAPSRAAEPKELAVKARSFMETYCYACHGKDGKRSGGFADSLDVTKLIAKKKLIPGKPADSEIIERITSADESDVMPPPEFKIKPKPDEIAALKAWIEAGAPPFEAAPPLTPNKARPTLTEADAYKAMADYLARQPEHAKYQRFVTLTHLFNDPNTDDAKLRLYQAGVSKLLNSLSWRKALILPRIVDAHGAVLAFDLRDLDWDLGDQWSLLTTRHGAHPGYPYALTHDHEPADDTLNALAREVYKQTRTRIPAVRADWLLATAALPPIYHELLNLPKTAAELEKRLGVDVAKNFERETLRRVGLKRSGIAARANRLLEWHAGVYGYYHKSYDFDTEAGRGDLTRFPLGPLNLFAEGKHPDPDAAFEHAGGEIIFALPNGMQGYLLVNGKGGRIDAAPEFVRDEKETAGRGTTVVNGLSCMACHNHGIKTEFDEEVVKSLAVQGHTLRQSKRIYLEQEAAQKLFGRDRAAFLEALDKVCGPFLKFGADEKRPIDKFAEPISVTAGPYLKTPLTLDQAARELGMKADALKAAIENNPTLRDRLALNALAKGSGVRREAWEGKSPTGESVFQAAAAELRRGTPASRADDPGRRLGALSALESRL